MKFAERAKAILTDSDVSARALAKRVGVSEQSMSNYLNGKQSMPYDVLVQFAEYFSITTDYLFGLADKPDRPFPVSRSERAMLSDFRMLTHEQKELIAQNILLMKQQNNRG